MNSRIVTALTLAVTTPITRPNACRFQIENAAKSWSRPTIGGSSPTC